MIDEILYSITPTTGDLLTLLLVYINIAIFAIIFPNEIVMFLVGFLVAIGKLHYGALFLVIAVNSTVSFIYYSISIKIEERYLKHSPKLAQARMFFYKYGKSSIFFSRLLPTLRVYISFVAGITHMDKMQFILYTIYGYGVLNGVWFLLGYFSNFVLTDIREVNFESFTLYSLALTGIFFIVYMGNRYLIARIRR